VSDTALVVIDVQRGMFAFPEQPYEGDAMLRLIADLVARARAASVPVIFVQHDGGAGHPLEKPGENWEIHPATGYVPGDLLVEKQNCDSFQATGLQDMLSDLRVDTLVLAGMMTEYCVDTACRRAFSLGYKVILAGVAHSTLSREHLSAQQIVQHHNVILDGSFATVKAASEIEFVRQEALA